MGTIVFNEYSAVQSKRLEMDIKIEPDDELSSSEDTHLGDNRQTSTSDVYFESHSTGYRDIAPVKVEKVDDGYYHEVAILDQIKIKKEDVDWQNCKDEVTHDDSPVVDESSNVKWKLGQDFSMESKNVKNEKEDVHHQTSNDKAYDISHIKIEMFEVGECSNVKWKPTQVIANKIDCANNKNNPKVHKESVAETVLEKEQSHGKKYACSVCLVAFNSPSSLETHTAIHEGHKTGHHSKDQSSQVNDKKLRYKCDQCSYKCAHPHSLKNHIMKHTGETPFKCEVCNFKCRISSHLKTHMNTHSDNKPYKCDVCDYKSGRSTLLKLHKLSHTGEKPFKCDLCDYKCVLMCYLKVHKMTHTGEKPYKCDMCEFQCRAYSQWKNHKMVHSGVKPFACDECNYKTAYSHSLKLHRMKHSGEKPFKCDQCDYKCTFSYRLKKHKLNHTGV